MRTTINDIEQIKDILSHLPEPAVQEVKDFAAYLADRERRRRALEESVLSAEKESPVRFESVEDAITAVFDESKD